MDRISKEEGGDTYMVNGNMCPVKFAGAAYKKDKEEDNAE